MKYLGKQTNDPVTELDVIEWEDSYGEPPIVELAVGEFTHLCPVTSQPDFGEIAIRYKPRRLLVETKSLKLFLWSFREHRAFDEVLIAELATELVKKLDPISLLVEGRFSARGGISVYARKDYRSK